MSGCSLASLFYIISVSLSLLVLVDSRRVVPRGASGSKNLGNSRVVRFSPNAEKSNAIPELTGTQLYFKLAATESAPTALAEVQSTVDSKQHNKLAQKASNCSLAQKASNWETEKDFYFQQRAVKEFWRHTTVVTDKSGTEIAEAFEEIKQTIVPGLDDVTFGVVFEEMQKGGCPLWILGGTVRDLVAGKKANDVDCVSLCSADVVRDIVEKNGWNRGRRQPNGHYFAIGDDKAADGLEGIEIGTAFNESLSVDWAVNLLMWSTTYDYVIDPSGHGLSDATSDPPLLRPAAPEANLYPAGTTQWDVWRRWVLASYRTPTMLRHVRYLKMRARGWEPESDCIRFFMANEYVLAAQLEGVATEGDASEIVQHSETYRHSPGAVLRFLGEKVFKKAAEEAQGIVFKFLTTMKEDLDFYFEFHQSFTGEACSARVVATDHPMANAKVMTSSTVDVLLMLFKQSCGPLSNTPEKVQNMRNIHEGMTADFKGACAAIRKFIQSVKR